ncbi:MAG: ankyrin repeat domain-containing protein [Akkermansia sp.]|nr:ankyrin repeat domain-containing protein [Akkermansia sp.]
MATDSELLSHELPAGYMLRDTYTLTETLGQGGFVITYLATDDITGRKVVIKENFPAEFSIRNSANHHVGPAGSACKMPYDWVLDKFLKDAKILTRLKHPNIVPVLTDFKALGTAYYVMDYIGGRPLHEAAPQQITEEWLLSILRPMLSALHYIHTLPQGQLLHLDITPNNILVTPAGEPVLINFGSLHSMSNLCNAKLMGTPGYAPPEQMTDISKCGPWTDIYALGATCYDLLTGQTPPECLVRNYAAPDSDLLAHRPELQGRFSPALLASIDKAFALRSTDRWQSAQEWMDALSGNSPANNTSPTPANGARVPTIEEPAPTPKITQQAAQAELQRRGISAEEYDSKLLDAAKNGETELVKLLIAAGADVNQADILGETPLHNAAIFGHAECVKLLLAAGADVNAKGNAKVNEHDDDYTWNSYTSCTPLIVAVGNDHAGCAKLLLAAGADVNMASEDGETPLYWAAHYGRAECAKLLIDAGADVNKADKYGGTPLYWTADEGLTEVMKLLIAAGADVNQTDKDGETPLYRAAYSGHAECVKLLINAGADVNKANKYGQTPLYWAAEDGHTECVKLLIAAGADVNKADKNGWTPLSQAAYYGHTDCVKLLIAAGADVNKANKYGQTPLYWAAEDGHTECVKLLIAAGADVNKADEDGYTPLYKAEEGGHTECAKLLRAAGDTSEVMNIFKRLFS